MNKPDKRVFLYSGLTLLAVAFLVRWAGVGESFYLFWIVFLVAILLKVMFLANVFLVKGFRLSLWLCFILAGVALIFISMVFKYFYPVPLLRDILFYGAISLKVTGLLLMLFQKKKGTD